MVVNLAAKIGTLLSDVPVREMFEINTMGSLNVASVACEAGAKATSTLVRRWYMVKIRQVSIMVAFPVLPQSILIAQARPLPNTDSSSFQKNKEV